MDAVHETDVPGKVKALLPETVCASTCVMTFVGAAKNLPLSTMPRSTSRSSGRLSGPQRAAETRATIARPTEVGTRFERGARHHVVVVGASLTGLATAVLLARAGRRVALVEAGEIAADTTAEDAPLVAAALAEGVTLHTGVRVMQVTSAAPCRIDTDAGPVFAANVALATGAQDPDEGLCVAVTTPSRTSAASYELPAPRLLDRRRVATEPVVGKLPRTLGRIRFVTGTGGGAADMARASRAALVLAADILQIPERDRGRWLMTLGAPVAAPASLPAHASVA